MWDNAPLLRLAANALFGLSLLAMLYGALHFAVHQPGLFPLQTARIETATGHVVPQEVLQVLRREVNGNLFTVDIERVRLALEQLPWVRKVSVRREFPNQLSLAIEEHEPLARWNREALVNTYGEIFHAYSEESLPAFSGQDGRSAEMARQYQEFNQSLAQVNLRIEQISLSPRHAWQVRLNNGLILALGQEEVGRRLARFVTVYPYTLAPQVTSIRVVDLRYRNGFAVDGTFNG
ncbi:MAG: cell division protein FtsQ/DivIB [Gallionella sp.]|nr:cell division protein FtsQ/DivIB [Gallionella sp.]